MKITKQDRIFIRTASGLERKLGVKKSLAKAQGEIAQTNERVDYAGKATMAILTELSQEISALENSLESYLLKSDFEDCKRKVSAAFNSLSESVKASCDAVKDSIDDIGEAIYLELFDAFVPIEAPWCRKSASGVVELWGIVSPASAENGIGTPDGEELFVLPQGQRPKAEIAAVCQGEGSAIWLLRVLPSGAATASRYRIGTECEAPDTTAKMPFHLTFLTEGE